MRFELLTLAGPKFTGEAAQVTLATTNGEIGILPHHEDLTAIAVPGPITVRVKGGHEQLFATFGGLLEVKSDTDTVRLLADEAEHEDELVQSEIEAALRAAEELKGQAKDKHELHRAQLLVDRHMVRLSVAKLRRRAH